MVNYWLLVVDAESLLVAGCQGTGAPQEGSGTDLTHLLPQQCHHAFESALAAGSEPVAVRGWLLLVDPYHWPCSHALFTISVVAVDLLVVGSGVGGCG